MNNLKPLFATLTALLVALAAIAETTVATGIAIGDYVYNINKDNSGVAYAAITGLTANGTAKFKNASANSAATTPSFITYSGTQYPVRSIEENAFKGCTKMGSVTIGYNMRTIGSNAFEGCTALSWVKLPSSITRLYPYVFNKCSKLAEVYSAKLTFPPIESDALSGMPSSVKLYVPNNSNAVESYQNNSTWKSKFASITRTYIASDFIISSIAYTIIDAATETSTGTVMMMGASEIVTDVKPSRTFTGGDGLKYSLLELTDQCFTSTNTKLVSYDDTYSGYNTIINQKAFIDCPALKTIKTCAKTIHNRAVYNCQALTTVSIKGPATIYDYGFYNCTSLSNIDLGSTTMVYDHAFYRASATKLDVPSYLNSINQLAFADMPNLQSINVNSYNEYYASWGGMLYNKGLTVLYCCPPCAPASSGTTYARNRFAPSTIFIGKRAFYRNTVATVIELPVYVQEVQTEAFFQNTTVREVHFGSQIKKVGMNAFDGCNKLTTFTFAGIIAPTIDTGGKTLAAQLGNPSSAPAYRIPPDAISNNFVNKGWYGSNYTLVNDLTTVDMVEDIYTHGNMGYSLISLYNYTGNHGSYAGKAEATIVGSRSISTTEFNGANGYFVQYGVLKYAVTSLRPQALKQYGSKYTLVDLRGCELIDLRSYSCENLTALTTLYTGPVRTIGNYAFDQAAKLQTIVFGEDLSSLGEYAFRGSKSIATITVPTTSVPSVKSTTFDSGLNKSKCNLRVRADMYEKFKAAAVWKDFYITDLDGNVPGSDPEYVLKIAGVTVTSSNAGKGSIVAGVSVAFYDTFVTISMDNVNYTDNYKTFIESSYPLTGILLTGTNKVVAAQFLKATGGNVFLNGNDEATLATTASNYVTVDANIRLIANGQDQTCLIFGMKNITSNGVARAFMGTSGYTTLSLNTSTGEFKSTNYSSNVISGIKKLELYETELTNCTYSSTATQYGNNGSVKFRNTAAAANKYDVNADGKVDVGDVNAVLASILAGGKDSKYDVNGDGKVDVGDVNAILAEILSPSSK